MSRFPIQAAAAAADTTSFAWRLDPTALPSGLSERAKHALATPRSTFSALCQANGAKVLAPGDDYVKTLQDLYHQSPYVSYSTRRPHPLAPLPMIPLRFFAGPPLSMSCAAAPRKSYPLPSSSYSFQDLLA